MGELLRASPGLQPSFDLPYPFAAYPELHSYFGESHTRRPEFENLPLPLAKFVSA